MRDHRHMILALASMGVGARIAEMVAAERAIVRTEQPKRHEEVAPHGPEISRQQRRKIERQQLKRNR